RIAGAWIGGIDIIEIVGGVDGLGGGTIKDAPFLRVVLWRDPSSAHQAQATVIAVVVAVDEVAQIGRVPDGEDRQLAVEGVLILLKVDAELVEVGEAGRFLGGFAGAAQRREQNAYENRD